MEGIKEFYDKTAISWSEEILNDRRKSNVIKFFYDLYSIAGTKNPRILDAGSGMGYDSFLLQELGASVVGVDFSEKSIEISEKNVKNCDFFVKDITLKLDEFGKFDGILCLAVLDYIDIMEIQNVFNNFSYVLKKGGLLFVSVLDGCGKNEQKSIKHIEDKLYDLNFSEFSAEQLCTFAFENFKLVDTVKFDDFNSGWRYYVFMKK